jgi:hypothetical protein
MKHAISPSLQHLPWSSQPIASWYPTEGRILSSMGGLCDGSVLSSAASCIST